MAKVHLKTKDKKRVFGHYATNVTRVVHLCFMSQNSSHKVGK